MKSALPFVYTLLLVCFFNNAFATKRALIVAIGNYDRTNTGWPAISSLNDVPLIDSILNQNGFTDIVVLKDEQATKEGVMNAWHKLVLNTRPGDVVLVHFSSHGQLMEDEKGENSEEAIVTWGAPMQGGPGYKGEKHLVYSDIKMLRDTLRAHAGPTGDVILFFDACNSGGLTRGIAKTRGGALPITIVGFKSSTRNITRGTDAGDGYLPADNMDNKALSPYVAISACRSDEENFEYTNGHCGALSYALSRSFSRINGNDETYTQVYTSLLNYMYDINPGQHPVISGSTNRRLFAGQAVPIDPHFVIKDRGHNGRYILNGGIIDGLTKGTVLEAYPAGVKSKKDSLPLFKITVADDPGMLTCEVSIDTAMPKLRYIAYWFYVKQVAFNGEVVRLSFDSLSGFPDIKKSATIFFAGDTEVVLTSQTPCLTIGYNSQDNAYNIYNSISGMLIHSVLADNSALKTYLVNYAQCMALKKIAMSNPELSFSMDLKNTDGSDIRAKKGGMIIVKEGEKVKLTLLTKHEKPLYINIFDFQPDGTFQLINQGDCKLSQNLVLPVIAGKPDGIDMLLAIASPEPLNLSSFQASSATRGVSSAGSLGSLQKIFRAPATRGLFASADEEGFSVNLTYEIQPK